jgi:hypothetical protein
MNTFKSLSKKSETQNQVLYRIYTEDREDYRNRIIDSLKCQRGPLL